MRTESKTTNDNKQSVQREKELNRFFDLMGQFIHQISDDTTRETMDGALDRMRLINAE